MAREVGDKLGTRLLHISRDHQLALRRQLAPLEAKIHAAGTQQVIDRAGLEVAGLWRPFIAPLVQASGADMHPTMLEFLQRTSSGAHQWEAISGSLAMSASGALGSVLSNYLFPATGPLNLAFRNLPVQADQAAAAVAAGLATYGAGDETAGAWGLTSGAFDILYKLAQQIPGAAQLLDLYNRGILDAGQAKGWLQRAGVPAELIGPLFALQRQLVPAADAALAVLRGNITAGEGLAIAKANGYTESDFNILIGNTGEPPALEEMLMLWRRNQMDTPTLERAIRQSRVRDEWIPFMLKLAIEPPSAAEILDARVQGQVSDAEARKRFAEAGGDPTWYDTAYASTANSPAPVELAEMANRGIIPWTGTGAAAISWQEGFLEGRWKDKWAPAFRQLAAYHPPPREIGTLTKEAGLSEARAMQLWEQAGLPPDLAHEYWVAAHYTRTSATHELAKSEIIKLYSDRAISADVCKKMLVQLGYSDLDATWEIDIADLAVERKLLESAISKIRSLYIGYKLTEAQVTAALAGLDVPASQAKQDMAVWGLERAAAVKVLTPAEITDAYFYTLIEPAQAQTMLQQLGYSAYDAWLLISIKAKGPIDGFPAPAGGQ